MATFEKIVHSVVSTSTENISLPTSIAKRREDIPNKDELFDIGEQALIVVEKLADLHRKGTNTKYAVLAATQTVNALLEAVVAQCELDSPPADIEMKMDAKGNLIYRCYHNPAHEWNINGILQ